MIILVVVGICAAILGGYWMWTRRTPGVQPVKAAKTSKKQDADSRRLPYRYDQGSLFVWDRSVWVGFKVRPSNDGYLPAEELEGLAVRATAALTGLTRDSETVKVQLRMTHRPLQTDEWREQLLQHAWNPSKWYRRYTERIADMLMLARITVPVTYLFVQIDLLSQGAAAALSEAANAALMGGSDEFVAPAQAAEWELRARQIMSRLDVIGGLEPTTRDDRMWIIRKTLSGHFIPAMGDFPRSKPWGAGEFLLWLDFRADNAKSHLKIHCHDQQLADTDRDPDVHEPTSYTACLAVADWPELAALHGGMAWWRWLAKRDEQPEVMYRMELVPPAKFLDTLQKAQMNLQGENADLAKVGGYDAILAGQHARAEEAVTQLRTRPAPGVRGQIVIQLSSPTERGLQAKVESLIQAAKRELNEQVILVRPRRWQWRLLQFMLPGADVRLPAIPYVRTTDSNMFGIGLPNGGSQVGDRTEVTPAGTTVGWVGDFIGFIGSTPTFYSTHVGPARNNGGGVAVIGASGSGKSNLAMLLFLLASESGTRCAVLDPKVDFAQACLYLAFGPQVNDPDFDAEFTAGTLGKPGSKFTPVNPEFWSDTDIIDVVRSKAGVFDAWVMEKSTQAGRLLATDQFQMFLGPDWDRFRPYVVQAMAQVIAECEAKRTRPSMWKIAQRLIDDGKAIYRQAEENGRSQTESEAVRGTLGLTMAGLIELPYANLVFAENADTNTSNTSKRRIIYTLRGMAIPSAKTKPEAMTESQRFAVAIMYLLTRLASSNLSQSLTVKPGTNTLGTPPNLLVIDEANMVVGVDQGAQLVKESFGKGRSYNLATMLIDQLARRIANIEQEGEGEATGNQVSTTFGFMQKSMPEARAMLPLYGRDGDDGLAAQFLKYPQGQLGTGYTLMRDVDNKIGLLEVTLVFREIAAAFDTNPQTRATSQSRPLSPDPREWTALAQEDIEQAREAAVVMQTADENEEVSD